MKQSVTQILDFFKKHKYGKLALALVFSGAIIAGTLFFTAKPSEEPIPLSSLQLRAHCALVGEPGSGLRVADAANALLRAYHDVSLCGELSSGAVGTPLRQCFERWKRYQGELSKAGCMMRTPYVE